MKDRMVNLLTDLDESLTPLAGGEQLRLYHIGRSALVWKYGFSSVTVDLDFILPKGPDRLVAETRRLFGKGTEKATAHGLYLELVSEGLPPVPAGAEKRAVEAADRWRVIRLFHLEDNDLAATKLKRFAAKDREDIRRLCDMDKIDPEVLETRLASAFQFVTPKDGDPDYDRAFANLRRVQKYIAGEINDL